VAASPPTLTNSKLVGQTQRSRELILTSEPPGCGAAKGGDLGLCAIPTDNIVDEDESSSQPRDAMAGSFQMIPEIVGPPNLLHCT